MTPNGHDERSSVPAFPPQHVQTKREIESILARAGLRPRKRLGQHFLIDGNLMRRLVEAAELEADDVVLEVGAGTGGLTDLLADRVRRVVSVEVDRDLFSLLEDRFADRSNVVLVHTDVLERKNLVAPQVIEALIGGDTDAGRTTVIKLVANLPYQIATPLVMNLLLDHPCIERYLFTVQAEVGDRLLASPGSRDYGPLAIVAQTLGRVTAVTRLPPHVFWPRPEVDSVMIRLDTLPMPFADRATMHRFVAFVRGVFTHRRKTLRAALRFVVDDVTRERICARFDPTGRPETLSREAWLAMFALLS